MDAIVLATKNKGKVAELAALLQDFHLEVRDLAAYPQIGDIPETGSTFAENSLIKARAVAQATGLIALADDSGLVVDALGGAPGVYSARYADPADPGSSQDDRNNRKLLAALADVPDGQRAARFVSVVAAAAPTGETLTFEGTWEGRVGREPQGENGFGYDPLFIDPESGLTAAQMSRQVKNGRSHRAKALARLLEAWPEFWSNTARSK